MLDLDKWDTFVVKPLPTGQIMKKTMLKGKFVYVIDKEFFKAAVSSELAKRYKTSKKK